MQMSAIQLFVFVEGKECDPFFFAELCLVTLGRQTSYNISTASQIPGDAGGKQALLAFFDFLRGSGALVSDLGGKRTACVFFLDKDVDDLQRIKRRSSHAVYTQHYDVQNYVFQHGDLVRGAASAASVDCRKLEADLSDASRWCFEAARRWRDWVGLCLRLLEDGIPCEANYRVLSRVQTRPCGPTDPAALRALTRDIARRARMSVADLRKKLAVSAAKVDRYYERGEHHRIFKGKWFASILADEIDRIMAGAPYDSKGLSGRIPCAIAATLDFSEPWADYFKDSLRDIVATL
jgi:hypothetical protein